MLKEAGEICCGTSRIEKERNNRPKKTIKVLVLQTTHQQLPTLTGQWPCTQLVHSRNLAASDEEFRQHLSEPTIKFDQLPRLGWELTHPRRVQSYLSWCRHNSGGIVKISSFWRQVYRILRYPFTSAHWDIQIFKHYAILPLFSWISTFSQENYPVNA